jgi:mannose-6-phosphate isomerase
LKKLTPIFKDYIWGGTRLKTEYGKVTELPRVAESWELYEGRVLIKLIDAKERLSVQVHPGDEYANLHENGLGKTEMWVVLDCEPGASLCYGFNRALTRDELRRGASDGSLTGFLRMIPVGRGDVFFIPAGTVHAIGGGILLAEIQQNSSTTYRLYDYGRLDADGNPRPLHLDRALDVALLEPSSPAPPGRGEVIATPGYSAERLTACDYFTVDRITLSGRYAFTAEGACAVLCCEGNCAAGSGGETLTLTKGGGVTVPEGDVTLTGDGMVLIVYS